MKREQNKTFITLIVWILYIIWLLNFNITTFSFTLFLCYLVFLLAIVFIYKDDLKKNLIDFKSNKKNVTTIAIYFIILLAILFVSNFIISLVVQVGHFATDSSNSIIYSLFKKVPFGTLFVFFLTIFFFPIIEELVFRKSLRDVIKNPIFFVVFSSLITWYFQATLANPQISEFVFSITIFFNSIFASIVLVKKSDNILYTIFPRMIYNVLVCLIQLISLIAK